MANSASISTAACGGFGSIASAFVVESLEHIVPWLIVTLGVILCDLICGVRKSFKTGEIVRFSRAIRETMGKTVTYFAFVVMVCMVSVASGNEYPIEKWSCLLVCFIEGCSIISNILKPKGINVNFVSLIGVICEKVFNVRKEDIKEVLEDENHKE